MSNYFSECPDEDEIRQGDIISRMVHSQGKKSERKWGVVVTADCDIAQNKSNNKYTWLEIVPSEEYMRYHWAPDMLRRIIKKHFNPCLEYLNIQIKKSELGVNTLDEDGFREWLNSNTADEILSTLNCKPEQNILAKIASLKIAHDRSNQSPLKLYQRVHQILGGNEKGLKAAMTQGLEGSGGFPDFFFLPEVPPANDGIGFVVLLRHISTLNYEELFKTEMEARVSGCSDHFHRVGRLSDPLRFSISQKMAFLYSRIGMEVSFEEICTAAIEISVDQMLSSMDEK